MPWQTLIVLILQEGLPLALKLAERWSSKDAVTPAELEELKALAAKTSVTQMQDALARAGVSLDLPGAKALVDLVR